MLAGSKKLSSILTVTSWPCAQAEGAKTSKATRESVASSSSRLIWGSSLFSCPFPLREGARCLPENTYACQKPTVRLEPPEEGRSPLQREGKDSARLVMELAGVPSD